MIMTGEQLKEFFRARDLHVGGRDWIYVAAEVDGSDSDVRVYRRACSFRRDGDQWLARCSAGGMLDFEVSGPLDELVSLVARLFEAHLDSGTPLPIAFRELVEDADAYLIGDGVPRIRPAELRVTAPAAPTG